MTNLLRSIAWPAICVLLLSSCGGSETAGDAAPNASDAEAQAVATGVVIVAQPSDTTVARLQRARFSVRASTTGFNLRYQWYRNGKAIRGAVLDTYETPKLTSADDGASYAARVSDSGGARRTRGAVLRVTRNDGPLANMRWSVGHGYLGEQAVDRVQSGMDDAGRVIALFVRHDGTRDVLYAVHGLPGAAGKVPVWSEPQPIDMAGGVALPPRTPVGRGLSLHVSPAGNAIATWWTAKLCTPTSPPTSRPCQFLQAARYLAAAGSWEEPVEIEASEVRSAQPRINDAGDVAVAYTHTEADGFATRRRAALARRAKDGVGYTLQALDEAWDFYPVESIGSTPNSDMQLDNAGRILMAGRSRLGLTTDMVLFRGSIAAGLGAREVLARPAEPARFQFLAMGLNGTAAIGWRQSKGAAAPSTTYVATFTTPVAKPRVTDLGTDTGNTAVVDDAGNVYVYSIGTTVTLRKWLAATRKWSTRQTTSARPSPRALELWTVARNGDLLGISMFGAWELYDASRNRVTATFDQPGDARSYLLGVRTPLRNAYAVEKAPHLSPRGIGAYVIPEGYSQLPSPQAPDGRKGSVNAWAFYLKR